MQILRKYKIVIIVISILFVGYNLFDKFYYPELTLDYRPPQNRIIVNYKYFREKQYDEDKAREFVEEQILEETADQRIIKIYQGMKKDQNISISKNKINNSIYIFTNSHKYKSEMTVYRDDGFNLVKEKTIHILHPYKVGSGEYDEENQKIYLGVIRARLDEGGFLSNWINGFSVVEEKECYTVYFGKKKEKNNNALEKYKGDLSLWK